MAGLDAPWRDELGILPLPHLVQPWADLRFLCVPAAMAARAARAIRRGLSRPGRRARGFIALRPAGSHKPDRSRLALARARPAADSARLRGRASCLVGQSFRLRDREHDARHASGRPDLGSMRANHPIDAATAPNAGGLSACALGDLGMPDRPAGIHLRRDKPKHDAGANALG